MREGNLKVEWTQTLQLNKTRPWHKMEDIIWSRSHMNEINQRRNSNQVDCLTCMEARYTPTEIHANNKR